MGAPHTQVAMGFGTAEQLLTDYRADEADWIEADIKLFDACPFAVALPKFEVEVLDKPGFLLDRRIVGFSERIPLDERGRLPSRQPRWIARAVTDLDDCAGTPARVVVRMVDP